MCTHFIAPRLNAPHFQASVALPEDWSQSVCGCAAPNIDSCGFSAALSSALLMTHNPQPRLVCIDAKVGGQRFH
jgi:hypothetical protein